MNVILVDENDVPVGTMEKMEAHRKALLHRAFSVFIFNKNGEMLLQKRAEKKYHSALLWTNACCSHPAPGQATMPAALNRLSEEMGFTTTLHEAFHFVYKVSFDNGLTEHEFDHVFVGTYDGPVCPNNEEVSDYCYKTTKEISSSLISHSQKYTAWFRIAFPKLQEYLATM